MPPNVVVLHSHDTGRHVAPYGHAVPTPNLDTFADESLQFRRAHSPAPTCSPSRAALTTGLAPHATGMTGLVNRGWTRPVIPVAWGASPVVSAARLGEQVGAGE